MRKQQPIVTRLCSHPTSLEGIFRPLTQALFCTLVLFASSHCILFCIVLTFILLCLSSRSTWKEGLKLLGVSFEVFNTTYA